MTEQRTPEQIRGEIEAEREHLAAAIGALETDAKRTGVLASYVVAAAAGVLTLRKLITGRRRRKTT